MVSLERRILKVRDGDVPGPEAWEDIAFSFGERDYAIYAVYLFSEANAMVVLTCRYGR